MLIIACIMLISIVVNAACLDTEIAIVAILKAKL